MKRLLCLLGLALVLALALPAPAQADVTVPLSHGRLHLPIPKGYCALDTDRAREAGVFDVEAKTFSGRARLLAMAADCGELSAFREHKGTIISIVTFLLALKNDQAVRRPDAERAQYLDALAGQFGKATSKDYATNADQWWNLESPTAEPKIFGLVERDSVAIYLQAVRMIGQRDPAPIASVSALTLLDGYEVAVNFYLHADEHGVPGLLALAEIEAQALVAANVPPPPPPVLAETTAPSTVELSPTTDAGAQQLPSLGAALAKSGSTIAIAAGGVLLISVLLLLIFRRSPPQHRRTVRK